MTDSDGLLDRLVQEHMKGLTPYEGVEPPEVLAERAGIAPEQVVKLDANENPYGASPRIAEALVDFPWNGIYPDPAQRRVRVALAAYAGTDASHVIAGSGADELIDLLMRLFVAPGERRSVAARELRYQWDFGDNEKPSTGKRCMHVYPRMGDFVLGVKTYVSDEGWVPLNTGEVTVPVQKERKPAGQETPWVSSPACSPLPRSSPCC